MKKRAENILLILSLVYILLVPIQTVSRLSLTSELRSARFVATNQEISGKVYADIQNDFDTRTLLLLCNIRFAKRLLIQTLYC